MNPLSALQQQFPLSIHKKYWKKIIQQLVAWYILGIIGFAIFGAIIFIAGDTANTLGTNIMWGAIAADFIFLIIITLIYNWYIKTYIKRYYYAGEEHFITIKKGVFMPAEIHVQYQKIQDVYVDQDLLDRMMGLYDVHIASATMASGIEAHIDGVDQATAEGLKKFFLDKLSGISARNNMNTAAATISATTAAGTPAQSATPQQKIAKINLAEAISSKVYPLSSKWTVIALLGRLVSSILFPLFVIIILFSKSKDMPASTYWVYIVLGWIALSLLTMIVRTITLFLWKNNYAFDFTPEHIYYKEGVISLSEKHMPYSSIQDVTVQQSFLERLVGLAKVRIENAAQQQVVPTRRGAMPVFAGVLIQGVSIEDANKITDILKTTVLGKNTSQYGL
ncbi:MAG: PH domain-containing protein [bacterium]